MGIDPNMTAGRRADLDWIRIGAFALLILYHIGMLYVPWAFHVKSRHIVPGLVPFMLLLNPWRLSLLFLVSGAATRFMAEKLAYGPLLARRSVRLLLPLAFGMLVVVPPQSWWQAVASFGDTIGFWQFYVQDYLSFGTVHFGRHALILPTWNHLWFVAYLWVYTLVLVALLALWPALPRRLGHALNRVASPWSLLLGPWAVLAVGRIILAPRFPSTLALAGDWANHALFGFMFAFGFLAAAAPRVWQAIDRLRWPALGLAGGAFATFLLWRSSGGPASPGWLWFGRLAYPAYQWGCILAILGFGGRWLRFDGKLRRYLTQAVFPYYIVHQTLIIGTAVALRPLALPAPAEAACILLATVAGCAASFELARRIRWLRPLFGLQYRPATPRGFSVRHREGSAASRP